MTAPNLSALATPHTHLRIAYSITVGNLLGGADGLSVIADRLNAAWRDYGDSAGLAVLYSPAVTPTRGPDQLLGLIATGFTSVDVMTANVLPSLTWDAWLEPMRSPSLGLDTLDASLQLTDVQLLPAAGTAAAASAAQPAARAAALTSDAAAAAAAPSTNPIDKLFAGIKTTAGRLLIVAVVLLFIGLAVWQGPALVAHFTKEKSHGS